MCINVLERNLIISAYLSPYRQVRSPSHKKKTVDSVDASVSNWMRYVNCSKTDMEANLEAFQFLGNIYYLVIKYIEV